jgi:hypothetical protein
VKIVEGDLFQVLGRPGAPIEKHCGDEGEGQEKTDEDEIRTHESSLRSVP